LFIHRLSNPGPGWARNDYHAHVRPGVNLPPF
jgi:hypothetical protein